MQTSCLANMMFAVGRFGNVVSDDSFHLDACFSFLSNILSICIATKRKNIGAGAGGAQPPFLTIIMFLPLTLPLSLKGRGTKSVILNSFQDLNFLQIIPHPFPLSCICSTLTETRQKACGLVVSFRSLSGLTSCRPSANPPPT